MLLNKAVLQSRAGAIITTPQQSAMAPLRSIGVSWKSSKEGQCKNKKDRSRPW